MNPSVILVTGAAGFIGSHTSDQLLKAGHRVVGVDNFRTGHRENLQSALSHPGFTLRQADVADPGVLDSLANEFSPQAMIHLAALVSVPQSIADPALNTRLNFTATQLLAEAALKHGVSRIVFASSAAVYGDGNGPISPYGQAKLASEELLMGSAGFPSGPTVRCMRYFNVFGPRQDPSSPYSGVISIFEKAFREGREVTIFGDGKQTRDFVSVHDVARANGIAATNSDVKAGVADICTGQPTTLLRVWEIFAGKHPGSKPARFGPAREGDIRDSMGNPAQAERALGFRAEWSVEKGLGELIDLK